MKKSIKKRKYPLDSQLECRKRRAAKHDKQVSMEYQAHRDSRQDNTNVWH